MTALQATRVDFYIFANSIPHAVINMACKIVEKAYSQQEAVYILTSSLGHSEMMDKALWTFNDTSFIPHHIHIDNVDEQTSLITIGHELRLLSTLKNKNILLNLTNEIDLTSFQQFKRMIEIVNEESAAEEKTKARAKYKIYRDNEFMLHSHHVKS